MRYFYLLIGIFGWLVTCIIKLLTKVYLHVALVFVLLWFFTYSTDTLIYVGVAMFLFVIYAYITREDSRAIHYSYVMQNGIYLKRLTSGKDRTVTRVSNGWIIENIRDAGVTDKGFISAKKVSKIKYYLNLLRWLVVDDSSSMDTTVIGYGPDILRGRHFGKKISENVYKSYLPQYILDYIRKEQDYLESQQYGRAFDLGTNRSKVWVPLLSILWMYRNSFYNFNYMYEDIEVTSKYFWYKRFTTKYFDWHFGYLPAGNSRPGRLVWFTEDIKHAPKKD